MRRYRCPLRPLSAIQTGVIPSEVAAATESRACPERSRRGPLRFSSQHKSKRHFDHESLGVSERSHMGCRHPERAIWLPAESRQAQDVIQFIAGHVSAGKTCDSDSSSPAGTAECPGSAGLQSGDRSHIGGRHPERAHLESRGVSPRRYPVHSPARKCRENLRFRFFESRRDGRMPWERRTSIQRPLAHRRASS